MYGPATHVRTSVVGTSFSEEYSARKERGHSIAKVVAKSGPEVELVRSDGLTSDVHNRVCRRHRPGVYLVA